ncbi:dentin sialophosphoprotein-like [Mizuhopecten yessoensis]|uniref:Uncharacterized protein n=1 Tax=Mizuhopecten yessoensis TaxID=6573 RepID=A0A210R476_MIZYE|nr:dentin sialophosphoprotein-like [Mizuhopecten yessoensis]XP_021361923.1 dentin sialophosphoprotein-like [Mizuhopecten yessoensis]XP_021361930.1 dentin sialophosphoprotein-like [Mizuhopecten yessoensis]OWF55766.1 hypothetical protein KP79_PYT23835 [Mizuhopecten yessoensis]
MMDFDSLKSDILKDTFDLIDDIKSGRDLDFRKMKLFSKPIDSFFSSSSSSSSSYDPRRRNSNQRVNDLKHRFSSIPSFSTFKRTSSKDLDRDNDPFKRTNVKRSESTYSTGSYDTTDSNETLSEMSDSSFSPGSSKSRSSGHDRTNSSSSDSSKVAELSKKLEENFMKDERHSMPHEMYSKCDRTLNDLDRPRSVPLNTGNPNLSKHWKDSDSNLKCFPNKVMNSRDLGTYSQGRHLSNGYDSDSRSTVTGSGSRFNSMSSFDFPSLSDRTHDFDGGGSNSPQLPTSPLSPRSPIDLSSPNLPNPPSYELSRNIYKSDPGGLPATTSLKQDREAWEERTNRIQDALKWLRSELGSLRAQDKALLSSLSRCQDTIEDIKKQRTVLNENDEDDLEEDEEEDEDHWEDWEIAEFDRQCREKDALNKLKPSTGTGSSNMTRLSGSGFPIRQDVQAVV